MDRHAYDLAISHIDLALSIAPEAEIPRLKIQKATYFRDSNRHEEAIDCIKELELSTTGSLSLKQQIDCAEIKLISYAKLQDADRAQECFDILKEIDPRLPKFTHTKTHIIIQNYKQIPNHEMIFKCTMIHGQIAENSSQIQFHDNGICVIKKMCHCGCQTCKDRPKKFICDCCGQMMTRIEPKPPGKTSGCTKSVCKKLEGAGLVFCGSRFQHPGCLMACCAVVYAISEGCQYCCSEGGFYENCIAPFANILDKCPKECEPIW